MEGGSKGSAPDLRSVLHRPSISTDQCLFMQGFQLVGMSVHSVEDVYIAHIVDYILFPSVIMILLQPADHSFVFEHDYYSC